LWLTSFAAPSLLFIKKQTLFIKKNTFIQMKKKTKQNKKNKKWKNPATGKSTNQKEIK